MFCKTRNMIICCIVFTWTVSASAYTVRIAPYADNWINSCSSGANTNNGSSQELRVRTAALWGDVKNQRSLLQFDLSDVPVTSDFVTNVTLGLYFFTYNWDSPVGRTYEVHRVVNPWKEMQSSWKARDEFQSMDPIYWDAYQAGVPSYRPGGGDFDAVASNSATVPAVDEWMTWDVTSLVKDWLNENYANYGLLIKDANEFTCYPGCDTISPLAEFRSRDYSNPTLWPYLEVTYIPEPGTLLLLGVGYVFLVEGKRKMIGHKGGLG